jgi:hypothetical protein
MGKYGTSVHPKTENMFYIGYIPGSAGGKQDDDHEAGPLMQPDGESAGR